MMLVFLILERKSVTVSALDWNQWVYFLIDDLLNINQLVQPNPNPQTEKKWIQIRWQQSETTTLNQNMVWFINYFGKLSAQAHTANSMASVKCLVGMQCLPAV